MTAEDEILRYIEGHRDQFTREAIDASLRKAGYDQAVIDAAWAATDANPEVRPIPGIGAMISILFAVIVVIGAYGLTILLAISLLDPDAYFHTTGAATTVMGLFVVSMVGGCIYSVYRLVRAASAPRMARAILTAFGISVAIFASLSGLCVAGLNLTP
jgi:hypothetical protein